MNTVVLTGLGPGLDPLLPRSRSRLSLQRRLRLLISSKSKTKIANFLTVTNPSRGYSCPSSCRVFPPQDILFLILPLGRRGCGSRCRCFHGYMLTLRKLDGLLLLQLSSQQHCELSHSDNNKHVCVQILSPITIIGSIKAPLCAFGGGFPPSAEHCSLKQLH